MMNIKPLFVFCALLTLFIACNPAGKMVKEGDNLRVEGKHEDATTYYYNALLRKPKNENAKEGLSISAQHVLNEKFNSFNKLVVENNVDEAMKTYKNAEKYYKTAADLGVQLRWPTEYDEVYADIRAEYVARLYDEALAMMGDKRYEQAERQFERIAALDSSYRGITVLRLNTVLEPLYQLGINQMNQGKYKQAYQTFSKIVQQDDTYKDAKVKKEEAINNATTTIGILPAKSVSDSAAFSELDGYISGRMMQHNFAYVKVLAGKEFIENLESRGWVNIKDIEKAAEAGKNLGLKYVLLVTVKNVEYQETPPITEQKNAYEAFSENILNPYTGTYSAITKFRKVTYNDTYEKRVYKMDVGYQLISTSDNKVVLSNTISPQQKGEQHQLVYKGNINNIYQELPTGNYLPPINQEWRDLFTNIKRAPPSKEQLASETHRQAAQEITAAISGFFK